MEVRWPPHGSIAVIAFGKSNDINWKQLKTGKHVEKCRNMWEHRGRRENYRKLAEDMSGKSRENLRKDHGTTGDICHLRPSRISQYGRPSDAAYEPEREAKPPRQPRNQQLVALAPINRTRFWILDVSYTMSYPEFDPPNTSKYQLVREWIVSQLITGTQYVKVSGFV